MKLQIEDYKKFDEVREKYQKLSDFRFEVISRTVGANINPATVSNEQILHILAEYQKRWQQ